jgi:hypothetical protein
MIVQHEEYVAAVASATVQKLQYGADPWRIITADGLEVTRWVLFAHPFPALGTMPLNVSGHSTRQQAQRALDHYNNHKEWPPEPLGSLYLNLPKEA